MMTVSRKVEYSLILISCLANLDKDYLSLKSASRQTGLPYRFLGQLAGKLKRGGILLSREGKGGGYYLASDWRQKSLYDLIGLLGEDKHLVRCLSRDSVCGYAKNCGVQHIWYKLEKNIRQELDRIKLKEV